MWISVTKPNMRCVQSNAKRKRVMTKPLLSGGCVDCIYEDKDRCIAKNLRAKLVTPATQTVLTPNGQRDLCDRHAALAEKRIEP